MTASVEFLSILIGTATGLAALAPILLLVLWVRDARRGELW